MSPLFCSLRLCLSTALGAPVYCASGDQDKRNRGKRDRWSVSIFTITRTFSWGSHAWNHVSISCDYRIGAARHQCHIRPTTKAFIYFFLAQASAFLLLWTTLPRKGFMSLSCQRVCDINDGVCLNVENVWIFQPVRWWWGGDVVSIFTNAWNQLTEEKITHLSFSVLQCLEICKKGSTQLQLSSWSHEITCECHFFTVMGHHSCDHASNFFPVFHPCWASRFDHLKGKLCF